jgi:hypothetical protein
MRHCGPYEMNGGHRWSFLNPITLTLSNPQMPDI